MAFDPADDFEDLFDNAPCGYLAAGPDGRITKVNCTISKWLGRDKAELVGQRFQDHLNIAGKIYFETHFAPLLRMQGFFNEVALDLVRADGTTLPVLVNAVERLDDAGRHQFTRITVFNASDRRRYERELLEARRAAEEANAALRELNRTLEERVSDAVNARLKSEEALRQAQKMDALGQLTGGIAHDFNNMLAVVLSALSLLEKRLANGEDLSRYIAAAKDGAHRAADLTKRLLAFSHQQKLAPQLLNANDMVADMLELLRRTLGENMHLNAVFAEDLWEVFADRNLLENALLNLSINARDAMPEGGRLTIETANRHLDESFAAERAVESGEYIEIAVTDTGTGMSSEVIAKAFEPFFTTKGVGKGTGLGLSQVYGFVKQSNGHIEIDSRVGQGTTIKIYLPRHQGSQDDATSEAEHALALASGSEAVLLVEDDEQVLSFTAQLLSDLGYRVIETRNAGEALDALAESQTIDLLFTDLVLPDMSGRQLVKEALQRRPHLKILFTTGYTAGDPVHSSGRNTDAPLLRKPASLEQISAKVREVLNS